jgi:hypothetical protein
MPVLMIIVFDVPHMGWKYFGVYSILVISFFYMPKVLVIINDAIFNV